MSVKLVRNEIQEALETAEVYEAEPWPDPEPIPNRLLPVPPFDSQCLPEAFRPWIEDIAERMQCPPDFPAVGAMVVLSSVVGRKVGIRPRRLDDWLVVPNLWGAVIGRSGVMKTPALQEPMHILHQLEKEAKGVYDQACLDFEAARIVDEARKKDFKNRIDSAVKKKSQDALALARQALKGPLMGPPARKRHVVNDSSVEKLGEILSENSNGVLLFRDELTGFLKALDKPGSEGSRAFYLEAWNGNSRFTYDRIGRGTVDIESACVSILGGIQPGPLKTYLSNAFNEGSGDDGLIQRFQLMVWPDISPDWRNVDRCPETSARNAAWGCVRQLANAQGQDYGAQVDPAQSPIPFLHFASDAQEAFTEWRVKMEPGVRGASESPMMESHLSKYRSLVPSLALLIHLADCAGNANLASVSLAALEKALAWARYLESHARRVYETRSAACEPSSSLLRHIQKGDLASPFTLRDIYRKCWSGLETPETAQAAANLLESLSVLRVRPLQTSESGGRPTITYEVNPKLTRAIDKKQD